MSCRTTHFLNLHITRSDIRRHKVGGQPMHMVTLVFLRGDKYRTKYKPRETKTRDKTEEQDETEEHDARLKKKRHLKYEVHI